MTHANATHLSLGEQIHVIKLAPDKRPVARYDGWLLSDADPILILARWERPDLRLAYTTFAHGDLLLEAYYRQRPYNIFALFDGSALPPDLAWGEIIPRHPPQKLSLTSLDPLCKWGAATCPLKGLYINFTSPVQFDPVQRLLIWHDLALDIWTPVQGPPLVLDEDAYRGLGLARTAPALAQAIEQARAQLLHDAQTRSGLFASLPS